MQTHETLPALELTDRARGSSRPHLRRPLIQVKCQGSRHAYCSRATITAMNAYVVFLLYLFAILGFVAVTLFLNRMLGPKPVSSAMKLEPFECGATPVDVRNVKAVPIKYYAVAIIFILFDLETVFLFIWALGAQPLTGFMLATFGIFIFLLVLILLYVYKARLLEAVSE
jgi:NADH-quinone oxidoreductase subunit A